VAAFTQEELAAHYQDAVEAYLETGLAPAEAHRQALADLGEANLTSNGLKDAHLGHKRYIWATVASMINLAALLLLPFLYMMLGFKEDGTGAVILFIAADLILLGATVFVLLAMKQMLAWRFGLPQLGRAIWLAVGGLTVQVGADVASLLLFGYSHNIGPSGTDPLFSAVSGLDVALKLISLAGFLAIGLGLLQLARHLFRMEDNLYGLRKPVAILMGIMGFFFATAWIWLNLPLGGIAMLAGLIVQLAHLLLWPLLILLFFRAVYRPPRYPTPLA
jgi:hypothetical protein